MNYGYVNPNGEVGIKNELRYRLEAYLEMKQLMKSCKTIHVFEALRIAADEIAMR